MSEETKSTEPTHEEWLFARYAELGQIASNAMEERESLKEEVRENLDNGVMMENGTHFLNYRHEERFSFDHKAAVASGDLSSEILNKHGKTTVITKIVSDSKTTKEGAKKYRKALDYADAMKFRSILERLETKDLDPDLAEEIHQALRLTAS